MRLIFVLLFVFVCVANYAQTSAFIGVSGDISTGQAMSDRIMAYIQNVYEKDDHVQGDVDDRLHKIRDMIQETQFKLASELDSNSISAYSFAQTMSELAYAMSRANFRQGGPKESAATMNKLIAPFRNTNLELDSLKSIYNLIQLDSDFSGSSDGYSMSIELLDKIVQHPQFMRSPERHTRFQEGQFLLMLGRRYELDGQKDRALPLISTYLSEMVDCQCAGPKSYRETLAKFKKLSSELDYTSPSISTFESFSQDLQFNREEIIAPDSQEEIDAYHSQMAQIIQDNLMEIAATSDVKK